MRNELDVYDPDKEMTEVELVEELIMKCYLLIFDEDKKIPTTTNIFQRCNYEFDTKAYDIVYNISKKLISEEKIMEVLSKEQCVFRWGAMVCCDAQQLMFENIYEEETGFMLGDEYVR